MATSPDSDTDPFVVKGPATPQQRRKELTAAALFVACLATVPLFRTELYPFSRAPMFSDAPLQYCEYTVNDPDGRELDLSTFGLQRTYWGNPLGVGVGYEPPASFDSFGDVASDEELADYVQERLAEFPELPYVEVTQTVVGAVDDRHIGTLSWFRLHIDNPDHRVPGR